MRKESYPLYVGGEPRHGAETLDVANKYTGEIAARVALASPEIIDEAIGAAERAALACRRMPSHQRAEILRHVVRRLEERHEELAQALVVEAGKPIRDARGEVTRGVDTFRIAAEEATRIGGEFMPLDISARSAGYRSVTQRVPVGPCSFISPFNFPINLAAHKIAPAIAAGCPFVLKPASRTPVGALLLGEILAETDMPAGAFSILPCPREAADSFATDPRLKLLSFTGSPAVGWALKARAGKMKVVLELGGNAACVVDRDADLEYSARRIIIGAFYQSGQSCISVQRIMAHESVYAELCERLVALAEDLVAGDPAHEDTFLGPMISEGEARRVEAWVNDAVGRGARILRGGKRDGVFYAATFVENVPRDSDLYAKEAFGPVACVEPFSAFTEAVDMVNDSVYGLQAGVFTRDMHNALHAWDHMHVGGVVLGDIPSMRVDSMPYGGVKDSGLGREGVRSSIEHMTEERLLVLAGMGDDPR